MKIAAISWKNFRRLPDAELRVAGNAVFIGANETGKSSVLRVCHACLGAGQTRLPMLFGARDFTDAAKPLLLEVVLQEFDEDDQAAFPDEITPGKPAELRLGLEVLLNEDGDVQVARRFFPDSGHERGPSRAQLERFAWSYVAADRSPSRELGQGRTAAVRSILSGLDLSQDAAAFDDVVARFQNALDDSKSLADFRTKFAASLSAALPRDVAAEDLRVQTQAALNSDPMAGVAVTLRDGEHDAPLALNQAHEEACCPGRRVNRQNA